jgi:hypothetical protein
MPTDTAIDAKATGIMEKVNATRLSVNLSPEVAEALRWIASKHHTSITEAVRRSISTQRFIERVVSDGAKILIQEPGQPIREVVFF